MQFKYKIILASTIGVIVLSAIIVIILLVLAIDEPKPHPSNANNREPKASEKEDTIVSVAPIRSVPESTKIHLYFVDSSTARLTAEKREIYLSKEKIESIRQVIQELLKGSTYMLNPIPNGTQLQNVFWEQSRGYVYVDFSETLSKSHINGTTAELLTIQSIITTIQANFPEVRKVQILIDGRNADTLAGHIDISQPLSVEEFNHRG